jgi:phage gp16-like protein
LVVRRSFFEKSRVVLAEFSEKTMMSRKLEGDMTLGGDNWLYEEASLKKAGSSLLNSARKQ